MTGVDLGAWRRKRLTRTEAAGRGYCVKLGWRLTLGKMGQGHEWVLRTSQGDWIVSGWEAGPKPTAIRAAFAWAGGAR